MANSRMNQSGCLEDDLARVKMNGDREQDVNLVLNGDVYLDLQGQILRKRAILLFQEKTAMVQGDDWARTSDDDRHSPQSS